MILVALIFVLCLLYGLLDGFHWWVIILMVLSGLSIIGVGRPSDKPEQMTLDEILRQQKGLDYFSLYNSRKYQPEGNLYEDAPVLELGDYIAAATKTEAANNNIHLTKEREEYIEDKAHEIAWNIVNGR